MRSLELSKRPIGYVFEAAASRLSDWSAHMWPARSTHAQHFQSSSLASQRGFRGPWRRRPWHPDIHPLHFSREWAALGHFLSALFICFEPLCGKAILGAGEEQGGLGDSPPGAVWVKWSLLLHKTLRGSLRTCQAKEEEQRKGKQRKVPATGNAPWRRAFRGGKPPHTPPGIHAWYPHIKPPCSNT